MTAQRTEETVAGGTARSVGGIGGIDGRRFKGQLSLRGTDDVANMYE
jgi:hypothetical protein